jgi:hypothetical protein
MKSIASLETLTNLIYFREAAEIKQMGGILKKKIMEEEKQFFDVWMFEVSDEIQSCASAYGERFILEHALAALAKASSAGLKTVLERCIYLHCVTLVNKNIDWYLRNECVSVEAAADLDSL